MAWRCLDCGNKSSRKFPAGRCPACDSFNIKGQARSVPGQNERSAKRKKIDMIILILCWGSLLVLLLSKLF